MKKSFEVSLKGYLRNFLRVFFFFVDHVERSNSWLNAVAHIIRLREKRREERRGEERRKEKRRGKEKRGKKGEKTHFPHLTFLASLSVLRSN
jgi:hypothetical protein